MKKNSSLYIRKLTYSALFLALALVLPFLTGQIPQIGAMLSPMHYPVLLCGFVCGWPWGLAVGACAPILRSLIFGMPPMNTAIPMAFELAVYGLMAGLLYKLFPKKKLYVYVALILSMVAGRVVWGIVQYIMLGVAGTQFTAKMFLAGAVTNAVPGIILQIVLVPVLVFIMERAKLSLNK